MTNNLTPHPQHENGNELHLVPNPAQLEAMLRAIAPAKRMLYRKRLMRKAGKGLITAACVLFLAQAADNATQQPKEFPASDGIAQTKPLAVPVEIEQSATIPDRYQTTTLINRRRIAKRFVTSRRAIAAGPHRTALQQKDAALAVQLHKEPDTYLGGQVDLPSNTPPVSGDRLFVAGPQSPVVVLVTPNK